MKYKLLLLVAFIGLALFSYGYMANLSMFKYAGFAITASMFLGFMVKKLIVRKT